MFRALGLGLGGEVPIAAVYISEITRAKGRGRFVLLYELVFPIGLVSAALLGSWVVPNLGWHYMFLVGAAPAILALFMQRLLPESPRWLAVRGRDYEAGLQCRTLNETESQAVSHCPDATCCHHASTASFLVRPFRCAVSPTRWLSANVVLQLIITYGLAVWLPHNLSYGFPFAARPITTIWPAHTSHSLPGTLTCALTIDYFGRRPWFAVSFSAQQLR